jgi:hypothetical protein
LKQFETNKLEIIDLISDGQDCFASLPDGYIDNAMFVLDIVKITYSILVSQRLKLKTASLSNFRKLADYWLYER